MWNMFKYVLYNVFKSCLLWTSNYCHTEWVTNPSTYKIRIEIVLRWYCISLVYYYFNYIYTALLNSLTRSSDFPGLNMCNVYCKDFTNSLMLLFWLLNLIILGLIFYLWVTANPPSQNETVNRDLQKQIA